MKEFLFNYAKGFIIGGVVCFFVFAVRCMEVI